MGCDGGDVGGARVALFDPASIASDPKLPPGEVKGEFITVLKAQTSASCSV